MAHEEGLSTAGVQMVRASGVVRAGRGSHQHSGKASVFALVALASSVGTTLPASKPGRRMSSDLGGCWVGAGGGAGRTRLVPLPRFRTGSHGKSQVPVADPRGPPRGLAGAGLVTGTHTRRSGFDEG